MCVCVREREGKRESERGRDDELEERDERGAKRESGREYENMKNLKMRKKPRVAQSKKVQKISMSGTNFIKAKQNNSVIAFPRTTANALEKFIETLMVLVAQDCK